MIHDGGGLSCSKLARFRASLCFEVERASASFARHSRERGNPVSLTFSHESHWMFGSAEVMRSSRSRE
ncbi:hypothetical protein [Lysobacter gummosus]|uniref:hypothetical protein n=1 Tax=Lysobacter gummosus TaxID=262324 RepID=UPI003633BE5A